MCSLWSSRLLIREGRVGAAPGVCVGAAPGVCDGSCAAYECTWPCLQAQLGLAHAYSRAKVKFNVNRVDNMIIQAIALLDTLDKDINTFVMRVREWYSWHFPELVKVVNDNYQYSQLTLLIKDKSSLTEDKVHTQTNTCTELCIQHKALQPCCEASSPE